MEILGRFALFLVLGVPLLLLRGVVFQDLWGWFVTPAFGIQAFSLPICIGLMYVVSFANPNFNGALDDDDDSSTERSLTKFFFVTFYSLMVWGYGAIIASFV